MFVSNDRKAANLGVFSHLGGESSVRLLALPSRLHGSVGSEGRTLGDTSVTFLYLPSTTTVRTTRLIAGSSAIVVSASATRHADRK